MDVNWSSLIQTFGVAVSTLIFLAWCAVQAARWAAPRIDTLIGRTFSAVDKIEAFAARLNALEVRIENLWGFQLRRAAVEVVARGVGTVNSPVMISPESRAWLADLAEDLREFYQRDGSRMSDEQLAEEIEKRWGPQIVTLVCIPHGVHQGACLLIAMAVAKDAPSPVAYPVSE